MSLGFSSQASFMVCLMLVYHQSLTHTKSNFVFFMTVTISAYQYYYGTDLSNLVSYSFFKNNTYTLNTL